jgi:hypothetical protein
MARLWSKPLVVIVLAAGVVAGLVLAGRVARDWLDRRGHFHIALADIQCPVPPGLTRGEFLAEVQYLGGLPDRISTVDAAMVLRLATAFTQHPWVEQFESAHLRAANQSPYVKLRLRTPALAAHGRAIDGHGVLLPLSTSLTDLIEFRGAVTDSKSPAGAKWGDPAIESAAQIAAWLVPLQDRLRLTGVSIENGVFTFTGGVKLIWGGDSDAESKTIRLREILANARTLPELIDLSR